MVQTTTAFPVYDPSGSGLVLSDGMTSYSYDGEGRVCAVSSGGFSYQYVYDADGNRVAKGLIQLVTVNGQPTLSCDMTVNSFTVMTSYVLGPDGEQVTEMRLASGQTSWSHTNVFAGGMLLATYDPQGLHFQITDWLGSRRVQTNAFGQTEETCTNSPFGNNLNCSFPNTAPTTADDATELHFTGYPRDQETGNDFASSRYYASSMGKFLEPDDDSGEHKDQPQSWNLYSYVSNNPITNTDPDGHDCIDTTNFAKDGTVTVTRGDACASSLGPNGTYVNGTIDTSPGAITAKVGGQGTQFGYSFTSYDGQSGGGGVIATAAPYGPLQGPANLGGANMIGNGGKASVNEFIKQSLISAAFEGLGQLIGLGVDGIRAARAAKGAELLALTEKVTEHAYLKHAGEFGNITRNEFQSLVQETLESPSEVRSLSNGRTAYWSDSQQMVVIENGTAPSQSTAFRPTGGKAYFENLR